MEVKKITVIIPIYNAEKYLKKCVESVINQSLKDIEIILINDGSIDNSLKICKEISRFDSRIKVISQKNRGVSDARNKGLKLAKGEYIAFIDSDDFIDETFLEKLYSKAKSKGYDLVESDYLLFYSNKKNKKNKHKLIKKCENIQEFKNNFIKKVILEGDRGAFLWNKLFKSNIIKENNLKFLETILEDYLFLMEYCVFVKTYISIQERLYYYRISENSLSKQINLNSFNNLLYIEKRKDFILKKLNFKEKEIRESKSWFLNYTYSIINTMFLYENKLTKKEKIYFIEKIVSNKVFLDIFKKNRKNKILDYVIKLSNYKSIVVYWYCSFFISIKRIIKKAINKKRKN